MQKVKHCNFAFVRLFRTERIRKLGYHFEAIIPGESEDRIRPLLNS